jgi:hypothetical protein
MIALRDRMQWLASDRPVRDFQANHVPMRQSRRYSRYAE